MVSLPIRKGPRPTTHKPIPHSQIDQNPSAETYARLVERFLALPGTTTGASLISVKGAQALFVPEETRCNCDAFFRGREFAHVHPLEDGSFHMMLPEDVVMHVVEQGWGEVHPLAAQGKAPKTAVMIYAPRNEAEIEIALDLARASLRYATLAE